MQSRGWDALDVILVTGDTYIDSPFIGAAVTGRVLERAGYRVGIIAQPDTADTGDISRLGEPRLFWGVTGGSVDSMVANYSAGRRRRKSDDMTPGGLNNRRPDRAAIVYSNLIRRAFRSAAPIVLGGVEASMRRIAHYDFWSDSVRRSVLFDARADYLVYGMGEAPVVELARRLQRKSPVKGLRGVCLISSRVPDGYLELPPFEIVQADRQAFTDMFRVFYANSDPITARGLAQRQDTRYLIHNPPALPLTTRQLDAVHAMKFTREVHPFYLAQGPVKAQETIRFSMAAHRGCYGECNFCSITVHQGRTVQWRSVESVVREARLLARSAGFHGNIQDVGGPTANMYGFECSRKLREGACADRRCMYPSMCPALRPSHREQIRLLRALRRVRGVKNVFVASGIRHDLVLADRLHGVRYLGELAAHHISGQMKIAPEHTEPGVLKMMGKPGPEPLERFRNLFEQANRRAGKEQYLTYYLIAAHPGCTDREMQSLARYAARRLRLTPEQVQVFTPLPSTWSSVMYHTGIDPFTGERIFVEKDAKRREHQKLLVTGRAGGSQGRGRRTAAGPGRRKPPVRGRRQE